MSLGPVMFSILTLTTNNLQEAAGREGAVVWVGKKKEKENYKKFLTVSAGVFMTCLSEQCSKPPIDANNSLSLLPPFLKTMSYISSAGLKLSI